MSQLRLTYKEDIDNIESQIKEYAIPYDYDTKEYPIEVLLHKFVYTNAYIKEPLLFIPDYQRNFVWNEPMMCRFIESLLLGVPIQPIFAATTEEGRLEIIDGSQRTRSINEFVNRGLVLHGLKKLTALNGFKFVDLPVARQNKFNLITIRLHVVTDKAELAIRRDIFNRINTSGVKLSDSETRKGVYASPFYDFVIECANDNRFKRLCPIGEERKSRGEAEELVLRYFAYASRGTKNTHRGKKLLDSYLEEQSKKEFDKINLKKSFDTMLEFVDKYFDYGFKKSRSADSTPRVRFESISLGVHFALKRDPNLEPVDMDWLDSKLFREVTTSDSSGNSGRLSLRVNFVKDCLLNIIPQKTISRLESDTKAWGHLKSVMMEKNAASN